MTPAAAAAPVEPAGGLEPVIVQVQPPLDLATAPGWSSNTGCAAP
jgi:hypothetical protein